jgi:hypothetical protein
LTPEALTALSAAVETLLGLSRDGLLVLFIILLLTDRVVAGKRLERAEAALEKKDAQLTESIDGWKEQAAVSKAANALNEKLLEYVQENLPRRAR